LAGERKLRSYRSTGLEQQTIDMIAAGRHAASLWRTRIHRARDLGPDWHPARRRMARR